MKKSLLLLFLLAILLTGCTPNVHTSSNDITTISVEITEPHTTEALEILETDETITEGTTLYETSAEVSTETPTEPPTETPTEPPTETPTETPTEPPSNTNERDLYYSELVNQAIAENRKVVYLTFDDGSSTLTPSVLNILDEYGVHATFFVVGAHSLGDENAQTMYNEIINRGHSLGIHSFTHNRADIYASLEAFSEDCNKMYDYVIKLTGYTPFLWRFPGGSATMYADHRMQTEYIPYVESKGLTYYDWNVSSGDGSRDACSTDIYNNVINGVMKRNVSVVLLHDGSGHEDTINALPDILDTLINELNCLVVPITESTTPVQSYKN